MSDAPETIWTCDHLGEYGQYYPEAVEAEGAYGGTAVEYIRRDLVKVTGFDDMTDQDIDQVIKQAIDPSASHHARVALIPMLVAAIRADLSPQPKVKPLLWRSGEAKGGGAKYNIYEVRDGLWNGACYPHEEEQYRIGTAVSEQDAKANAQYDYERRILSALE